TAYTTQGPGWAKSMSGNSFDAGADVAVDGAGDVYTVGDFSGSADFDPGPGEYVLQGGGQNPFVLAPDGGGHLRAAAGATATTKTSPYAFGNAIALAGSNVYTTGELASGGTDDFDPTAGMAPLTSNGSRDIFVWKLTQASPAKAAARTTATVLLPGAESQPTAGAVTGGPRAGSADGANALRTS